MSEARIVSLTQNWKQNYAETTAYNYTAALREFLRYAERTGQAQGIAGCVPRAKRPGVRTVTATDAEIQTLLSAAGLGLRLLIYLTLDSAMRFSEAMQVGPHNFDPKTNMATVRLKGGKFAAIAVTERAALIVSAAQQVTAHGQSFIRTLEGHSVDASTRNAWDRLKKKCGIRAELHIHDLRRTTATRAYQATKDLRTVQSILNHDRLTSTLAYIAPHDPAALRPLLEALRIPTDKIQ